MVGLPLLRLKNWQKLWTDLFVIKKRFFKQKLTHLMS